ncbi:hypothetical protein V8E53_009354 [Lactarius tabidus]
MLNRAVISLTLLGLSLSDLTLGRMLWPERNNKAVVLNPRRFGQQNPGITVDIGAACPGQVCGPLSGQSINGLLAAADPCQQQNVGDAIINASRQFDATTQAKMVQLAVQYVQTERNSAPNFTFTPPEQRNSLFCQEQPANKQLNCLVQAQFSGNNASVFADPKTGKDILIGTDPRTIPLCQNHNTNTNPGNKGSPPQPGNTNTTLTNTNTTQKHTNTTQTTSSSPATKLKGCKSQLSSNGNSTLATSTTGQNLQTFTGTLGAPAPVVTETANNQFQVVGNAAFKTLQNAIQRSCDVQHNKCADAANASGNKGSLTVAACGTQQSQCSQVAQAAGTGNKLSSQGNSTSGSNQENSTSNSKQGNSTSGSKLGTSTLTSNGGQQNLQLFKGALDSIGAPSVVKNEDGKFSTDNSEFINLNTALERSWYVVGV